MDKLDTNTVPGPRVQCRDDRWCDNSSGAKMVGRSAFKQEILIRSTKSHWCPFWFHFQRKSPMYSVFVQPLHESNVVIQNDELGYLTEEELLCL